MADDPRIARSGRGAVERHGRRGGARSVARPAGQRVHCGGDQVQGCPCHAVARSPCSRSSWRSRRRVPRLPPRLSPSPSTAELATSRASFPCARQESVSSAVPARRHPGRSGSSATSPGAGADAAADAVLDGIVGWAADGATWLVRAVAVQIERSTRPALGSAWFSKRYSAMRQLAISLSLIFLLISIAQAALRRDLEGLIRACVIALPLAMLLTFAAVTLVELGLALTDELTAAALRGSGTDVREGVADLGDALKPAGSGGGALPGLVLLLGCAARRGAGARRLDRAGAPGGRDLRRRRLPAARARRADVAQHRPLGATARGVARRDHPLEAGHRRRLRGGGIDAGRGTQRFRRA